MPGPKTNEREGTRAVLRNHRSSAFKVRPVLDLVRGKPVAEAIDVLRFSERDAADLVLKLLQSAIANAENNDGLVADELFVSACYADEGRTFKTFRPRARGRAGRIRKRSTHITVIVSRLPEERLTIVKARTDKAEAERRGRRVAASQGRRGRKAGGEAPGTPEAEAAVALADRVEEEGIVDQQAVEAAVALAGPEDVDVPEVESAAEEAGIVDQQDVAKQAAEQADQADEETK